MPQNLERRIQEYTNVLNEIKQQLERPGNGYEQPKSGMIQPLQVPGITELPADKILVVNFTHPLTEQQREQIEKLAGALIDKVLTVPMQIDEAEPLSPQIARLVDTIGLSTDDWRKRHILINPPGYAPAAFVLLAEMHGRIGHFPTFIRMRPKHGSVTNYEAVEILNLQTVRDVARMSNNFIIKTRNP